MVSLWGRKKDDPDRAESFQRQRERNEEPSIDEHEEPTERTRLLRHSDSQALLSPDDPAVSAIVPSSVATKN